MFDSAQALKAAIQALRADVAAIDGSLSYALFLCASTLSASALSIIPDGSTAIENRMMHEHLRQAMDLAAGILQSI